MEAEKESRNAFRYAFGIVMASACLFTLLLHLLSFGSIFSFLNMYFGINTIEAYKSNGTLREILTVATQILAYAAALAFICSFSRIKPKSFFPFGGKLPKNTVLIIICSFGLAYSVNIITGLIFSDIIPSSDSTLPSEANERILSIISSVVIAPIAEELLFRGGMLQALMPFGEGFAVIASSFIFALCHGSFDLIVNGFVFGVVLSVCFAKTRSLKICLLIHFLNNLIAVGFTLLSEAISEQAFTIVYYVYDFLCIAVFAVVLIVLLLKKKLSSAVTFNNSSVLYILNKRVLYAETFGNVFFWFFIITIGGVIASSYI